MHAPARTSPVRIEQTLDAAERALRGLRVLALPAPRPDAGGADAGGSRDLDLYLYAARPGEAEVEADGAVPPSGFDVAPAFVRLGDVDTSGCAGRSLVARAVVEAAAVGLDAGAEPGARALLSSYVGALVEPCDEAETAGVGDFQAHPERAIFGGARLEAGAVPGVALFSQWLEDERSAAPRYGGFVASLVGIAGQQTPRGAPHWSSEPDVFDALRNSLTPRRESIDDLLLDFAVARAFVGDRSDERHVEDSTRFGPAGRVRFEWSVPVTSLPRRLAPARAVEATGASYVWVDLAAEPANRALGLALTAEWELPCLFYWAVVKVDRKGRETGRVPIVVQHGATRAEKSLVVDTTELSGLIVVGANLGNLQRDLPYDPDDPPAAHAWELTLRRE